MLLAGPTCTFNEFTEFVEGTDTKKHVCWRSKAPAKRGHIVAATLCPAMLPVRGKTRNVSEDFQKRYLCPGHKICVRHKCYDAWQNELTFRKHDHVSNVAATMCPRFAGPQGPGQTELPTQVNSSQVIKSKLASAGVHTIPPSRAILQQTIQLSEYHRVVT